MARLTVGLVFGIVVGVVAGAALQIHAAGDGGVGEVQDTPPDESPVEDVTPPTPEPPYSVWDRLAQCESTGNWHIEGRLYSGGLQFDRQTWLSYGGGVYASRASLASRGQQIAVAERLRAARGYQPWPACSRAIGVR